VKIGVIRGKEKNQCCTAWQGAHRVVDSLITDSLITDMIAGLPKTHSACCWKQVGRQHAL